MVRDDCCECPYCHALISNGRMQAFDCPWCGNAIQVSVLDIVGHELKDIDPNTPTDRLGELRSFQHPTGTVVCRNCGEIYPKNFSCCPNLLMLATERFSKPLAEDSASSLRLLAEFVAGHLDVAGQLARRLRRRTSSAGAAKFGAFRRVFKDMGLWSKLAIE